MLKPNQAADGPAVRPYRKSRLLDLAFVEINQGAPRWSGALRCGRHGGLPSPVAIGRDRLRPVRHLRGAPSEAEADGPAVRPYLQYPLLDPTFVEIDEIGHADDLIGPICAAHIAQRFRQEFAAGGSHAFLNQITVPIGCPHIIRK